MVRDGFYGARPRRRQRYRCHHPENPADFHRFTPAVMRLEAIEHRCGKCESALPPGQGPNVPRRYDHAGREIAAALVAVANGSTYEQAAVTARRAVVWVSDPVPRPRTPERVQQAGEDRRVGVQRELLVDLGGECLDLLEQAGQHDQQDVGDVGFGGDGVAGRAARGGARRVCRTTGSTQPK